MNVHNSVYTKCTTLYISMLNNIYPVFQFWKLSTYSQLWLPVENILSLSFDLEQYTLSENSLMPLISSNWVVTGISYLNIDLRWIRLPHEFVSRIRLIVFKVISKLSKVLEKISISGSLRTCSAILLYLEM